MENLLNVPFVSELVFMLLAVIISLIVTLILFKRKPKLSIDEAKIDNGVIRFKLENTGKTNILNLSVEACYFDGNYTYHFKIDTPSFISLPRKKMNSKESFRYFKATGLADSAKDYDKSFAEILSDLKNDKDAVFRVRVYCTHEKSTYGMLFEQKFAWKDGTFHKV